MNVNPDKLKNKIYGALYGVAIGDAIGMPTTFMSRDDIKGKYGVVTDFLQDPMEGSVHSKLVRGEYTDDTEMTFMLAQSIASKKLVDPEDISRRLVSWADENNILNTTLIGPSTRKAIISLKSGISYKFTGVGGTTNGCAMKISPVGIFDAFRPDESAVNDVINACMCTHHTAIAISGASAICFAVKSAISGHSNVDDILKSALRGADLGSTLMGNPKISVSSRIREAVSIADKYENFDDYLDSLYNFILKPKGALTEDSVPVALSIFIKSRGNFRDAILMACNLGGDSDTIGAMTGAIAGSYADISNIPENWINTIKVSNKINIEGLGGELFDAMQV